MDDSGPTDVDWVYWEMDKKIEELNIDFEAHGFRVS